MSIVIIEDKDLDVAKKLVVDAEKADKEVVKHCSEIVKALSPFYPKDMNEDQISLFRQASTVMNRGRVFEGYEAKRKLLPRKGRHRSR